MSLEQLTKSIKKIRYKLDESEYSKLCTELDSLRSEMKEETKETNELRDLYEIKYNYYVLSTNATITRKIKTIQMLLTPSQRRQLPSAGYGIVTGTISRVLNTFC
tara:strand:+ start:341 stop:655 length:315 start_codon:yes stop_codon:yes gene_type:complete